MTTKTLDLKVIGSLLTNYETLIKMEFEKLIVFNGEESDVGSEINRQMRVLSEQLSIIEGSKVSTVELEQWTLPEAQDALNKSLTGKIFHEGVKYDQDGNEVK